jgi:hypothetical protein
LEYYFKFFISNTKANIITASLGSHLSKKLHNLLFLFAFNAYKHNKACRELCERIVNKGKSKKLALIAVAHELLKQAFAIAKSGLIYDASYRSTLVRN